MTVKQLFLTAIVMAFASVTALEPRILSYSPLRALLSSPNPGEQAVNGNCPPDRPKTCASRNLSWIHIDPSESSGEIFCCKVDEGCCPNGCSIAGTFCCGATYSCLVGDFCCENNACCPAGGQCCSESKLCCSSGQLCCPGGQWCYQPGVSQCP